MPERVCINNRQRRWKIDRRALRALIERVLEEEGAPAGRTVEILFARDPLLAELNARYRGKSGPTDVLSFPADPAGRPPEEPLPLGEVIVSIDRALAQAAERGATPRREVARLLVHGVLHLLGYEHEDPRARARMRRREDRYLAS
ncbi:MAG: rRNA maturation RNase YbeY [Candidatus Eisenbacteria bacterium]|nr:rRNA maturation RNase YbeY [Candidatus Eisenbacteria bacterium]